MKIETKFSVGDEVYIIIQNYDNEIKIKKDTIDVIKYNGIVLYTTKHTFGDFDESNIFPLNDIEGLLRITKSKIDAFPKG